MKYADTGRPDFPSRILVTRDGARIRYFDTGEDLPALVLANGLGGPVTAWYPYLRRWQGRYRVLSWDYRGLYGSSLPEGKSSAAVLDHARDLEAVLDRAGVPSAALLGWSMGVQVALEFSSFAASRATTLVLISGTYGRPLRGVPLPFSGIVLPPLVRGVRRLHVLGSTLLTRASNSGLTYPLARRLKLISPNLDQHHFEEIVREFQSVDLNTYFELLERLGEHDAEPLLSQLSVPTLVIAGGRDLLTPIWAARKLTRKIRGAELYVIPGGSHYAAAEFPALVANRVEHFLKFSRQAESSTF